MENKKLKVWLPLLFSLTMIAGLYMGYKMRDGIPGKSFFYVEKRRPVQEILDLINTKYVDEVSMNQLADSAIEALLYQLDPHSDFIPAKDLERYNEDIQGSFFGIGIEFNMIDDTLHVVNVVHEGPAEKATLKTGDKILKAGDSVISGKKVSVERIRKILRGPLNSNVSLAVLRQNKNLQLTVSRGIIPITSLDASYMLDSSVGYIRLNKFSTQTYREFMGSLMSLKKQNMKSLVLDLRDNGGGVLEEAVEIADEFLSGDKLITYTEGKHVKKQEYRCRRQGQFETGQLVVLANEGSASASEILMGALQDWDRATIIGRRTFGKGLVQEQFNLSDNSALRLTVARYYTPVGRSIQRSYSKGGRAYFDEFYNRLKSGEMSSADSIRNDTTKVFKTQAGKRIYGGGGITPDIFVGADTSTMTYLMAIVLSKGIVGDFGYHYYLNTPSINETYKTPRDFVRRFRMDEKAWKLFGTLAAKDTINIQQLNVKDRTYLENALKSSVARQLFRIEGFYEAINADDSTINKALQVLKKK
jgi:carboxyl-terminal processing protease